MYYTLYVVDLGPTLPNFFFVLRRHRRKLNIALVSPKLSRSTTALENMNVQPTVHTANSPYPYEHLMFLSLWSEQPSISNPVGIKWYRQWFGICPLFGWAPR